MPDAAPKPATDNRLARLSAGTLVAQQRETETALRRVIREQTAEAATRTEHRREQERDAAVLALLLMASRRMASELASTLYTRRQAARQSARRRLAAELTSFGIVVTGHQWVIGNRHEDDGAHADHAADSLAGQWRGLAVAAALGAKRKERTVAEAVRSTREQAAFRAARTAETEVARAYADEHREALRDIVEHDRTFRDGLLADEIETTVMRQWSAMIDACERCWPLDGETVGLYESFPGGYEPGSVHIRCRCIETLVTRAVPKQEAA